MREEKNKKSFLKTITIFTAVACVVSIAAFVFLLPQQTHAALFEIHLKTLSFIVKFVLNLIQFFVGQLIKFATWLISLVLDFNRTLLEDIQRPNSFVYIGWTAVRDITNLGFVLGIIMIAVGVMLRYGGYTIEKTLPRLIVVALLVNFSLVIASVPIRIADTFSNFFLEQIGSGQGSLAGQAANRITQDFNYQKMVVKELDTATSSDDTLITEAEESGVGNIIASEASRMVNIIASIIIGVLILLVLVCFGGMLFVRYFNLAFLLVMSPAAWLMWIFPKTGKWWSEWWRKFTHWVLYAPVMLFFLWLTLQTNKAVSDMYSSRAFDAATQGGTTLSVGYVSFRDMIGPLMMVFFMIAGMKIASKLGYAGTELAQGLVEKTKKWGKTKLNRARERTKRAALESKGGKWGRKQLIRAGSTRMGRIFGAGVAARKVEEGLSAAQKVSSEYSREFEKELDTMSPDQVLRLLPTMTRQKKMAAIAWLVKKKKVKDVVAVTSLDDRIAAIEQMRKFGRAQDAADMEKKFGMTYDMMRALQTPTGEIEVEETVKDPETGLPKRDPVTHEEIKEIKRKKYQDLAGVFYEKFSPSDWSQMAETVGSAAFSSDPQIEGLGGEDQSTTFRQAYASAIVSSRGRAVHSTAPRLEGKNLDIFYTQTIAEGIRGLRKRISDVDTAIAQKREEGGKEKEVAILEERKKKLEELADKIGSVDPKKTLDPAEIQKKLEIMQQGVTKSKKGKKGVVISSEQVIDQELSELGQKLASSRASIMGGYTSGATPQQETTPTPQTPPSGGEKGK